MTAKSYSYHCFLLFLSYFQVYISVCYLFTVVQMLPWQTNKILIFPIFPVFSGFSSLFTFLHFSLILAYFGISLHIFVINFGKNFGKFQVCTKGKSAIGNRQVRNWGLRYILAFSHFSLIFIRSL